MEAKKIVHLHFKKRQGQSDYYFGSVLAIYDVFNDDDLGIKYNCLCAALRRSVPYENKKVVVNVGEIIRRTKNQDK